MEFKQYILEVLSEKGRDCVTFKTLVKNLKLNTEFDKRALSDVLKVMEKENLIVETGGRYYPFDGKNFVVGRIKRHERGFAFLIREDGKPDLFIPPKKLNGAFQGDKVLVRRNFDGKRKFDEKSDEAEVVKVLERGKNEVIGRYFAEKGFGFLTPDDSGFGSDIYIGKGKSGGAKTGEKVACRIISYPEKEGMSPKGEIFKVLGSPFDVATQIESILIENKARENFSNEVFKETENITEEITEAEEKCRKDLRDLLTITIDGDDARDFDDAISIIKSANNYRLYVHIADVTHFVKKGGAIDNEAYLRGTSIYLPERVIPMLPEKLCNGVCSLNPDVDRLALTVEMTFDGGANLVDKSVYKSIIRSNRRMTYKKVQAIFEGDAALKKEYADILDLLFSARELKDKMLARRVEKGFVDLDVLETNVYFENGELMVDKREGLESERVIEQFMIAANVAVAEFVFYAEMPFIYRIHPEPDSEKVTALCEFLKAAGEKVKKRPKYPRDFEEILENVKDKPFFAVINEFVLRTMQKAIYSSENSGHFGLNESCYCHFTSPIRRYPDLTVHRILKGILEGNAEKIFEEYKNKISEIAINCSDTERNADLIERAADDVYICKFMEQFIGDYFESIISGVTSFGVFVRLENSAEGLVPLESLPKDRYEYFAESYTLKGNKHTFKLGETLLVQLVASSIETGNIDFKFIKKL